jgi:hypothetical protein
MGGKNYIPTKDVVFLQWSGNFTRHLELIAPRIRFPEEILKELLTLNSDFDQKYFLSQAPETRTPVSVSAKNTARKKLEQKIRSSVNEYLVYNHLVTNEDRLSLGLHVRDNKPTLSPISNVAPSIVVNAPSVGVIEFQIISAKPRGQYGAEFSWIISDETPIDWGELINSSFCTQSSLRLVFEGQERGKTIYFAVRWVNTRGKKGVWSEIRSVIIA